MVLPFVAHSFSVKESEDSMQRQAKDPDNSDTLVSGGSRVPALSLPVLSRDVVIHPFLGVQQPVHSCLKCLELGFQPLQTEEP